jgi:parvulin-like peptidyl-prolyl isomerase
LPDGRQIPPLPADAPKAVHFGVVLVTYRGAEGSPSDARTKEAALAKAKELLPDAHRDFGEAVKKGDRGSTAQAGSMPRGVLEPGIEYVLFTLKKGEVYGEPIDTPRGYWILRRSD